MIREHGTIWHCRVALASTHGFSVFVVFFNISVSVGSDKVDDPKFPEGKKQIFDLYDKKCLFRLFVLLC